MIGRAGWWTRTASTTLLQPKKWNAHFCITFNFWWLARLVIGLEPHPPPVSSQKKWNAHFWITFNFWWSAGLVDELESHLPPLSSQKNEVLIFGLCSTSDDGPGWSMDSNPICHLSPAKEWNANFGLCSTSDDQLGWSMDSNPICYPSPNKKMICSFSEHAQLLMIGQAGQWTQTPSATSLQPKIWNVCFWITFNFWWSASLVEGLEPHLQPLSNQKNEMLIFVICSTSGNQPGWSMDSNPICHPSPTKKMKCLFLDYVQLLMIGQAGRWTPTPSVTPLQPKKWNACFWIMLNFWWLARLVNGLEPHLPSLSKQKNDMLILVLHSSSDHWPGWSMDSNPICNLSPGIKWNTHFCITFNLWWSAGLVNGLKPHLPPLSSQKNEMLIFGLHSTSDDQLGWLMDSNPICHPSPPKKNEMLIFGLCLTSDDQPGWLMNLNPICHPSPATKLKCSFLDYIQLLMMDRAGQWTRIPSTTCLQPKNEMLIFGLHSLLVISRAGWWTRTPSATPLQPKKWNACFCITL